MVLRRRSLAVLSLLDYKTLWLRVHVSAIFIISQDSLLVHRHRKFLCTHATLYVRRIHGAQEQDLGPSID